ncbi:ABC transporter substrate-binding protein [Jiangella alba]|uniref:Peptide/nickel transport system substrate-binding protein n=1 Tax=Jiangella alba TaxID=561176 RepID=A0A1H5L8A7_9ACTN|nr:ABC transporter substrate-binding protein [Jiangella alba]SEE73322.1 peptide/nickel transport system substrate-binding protein [Jiangella alba]
MSERRTRMAALALGALLALTACSTTTSGDTADTGGAVERTIEVAGQYPIEDLDPHGVQGASAATGLSSKAIFSRLVQPDPDGTIVADLAADWTADDDATEWVFTLRDDIVFSDGTPVTSADVVASFERLAAGDSPLAPSFANIVATADGDATVVLTAAAPDPALAGKLTQFFVLPASAGADPAAFFADPVGSGPFTVETFVPGEALELARNENYWGDHARVASVRISDIPEMAARLTALRTGEVDLTWGVPDDQLEPLIAADDLVVETVPSTLVYTMWFNSSTPALADAAVRRALWKAVDFETIIATLNPETGEPAKAPVAPVVFGYAPQEPVAYDPDAARDELAAAGFDFAGPPLRLHFSGAQFRPFLQAVVSDLTEIGVPVELLEKEQAVFTEDLLALNWDINFQQVGAATYDAATNLGRLYPCAAGRNGYCNEELDAALLEANTSNDPEVRQDAYRRATEIIWSEAVGMYPMQVKLAYAWRSDLEGVTPDPSGFPDFSTIEIAG